MRFMPSLSWNPYGAFAIAVGGFACVVAVFLFKTRPDRAQNCWLSAAVVLHGLSIGSYFGLPFLVTDPDAARRAIGAGVTLLLFLPVVYVEFLATIQVPLTRWLRAPAVRWLLLAYVVAVEALWLAWPDGFVDPIIRYETAGGWHLDAAAPLLGLRLFGIAPLAVAQLFGLVVAISAFRSAVTASARTQAAAFAAAFGTRDLAGLAFCVAFAGFHGAASGVGEILFVLTLPGFDLLFLTLLAYGILRTQLFDIDLNLKLALEGGAVAVPFAVGFFLISEGLESALSIHSVWLGLAAAGAIALALQPIQRVAANLADRIMPGVGRTPEYICGPGEPRCISTPWKRSWPTDS